MLKDPCEKTKVFFPERIEFFSQKQKKKKGFVCCLVERAWIYTEDQVQTVFPFIKKKKKC